jgi:hypothetical protein
MHDFDGRDFWSRRAWVSLATQVCSVRYLDSQICVKSGQQNGSTLSGPEHRGLLNLTSLLVLSTL